MSGSIQNIKSSLENLIESRNFDKKELRDTLSNFHSILDYMCEFEDLKNLLDSDEWPQAVYSVQIADENSEKDKEERAEGIADILLPPLSGKKFLDFGCGEGHVVNYAKQHADFSVGYDVVKNPKSRFDWDVEDEKSIITTSIEKVKSKGPYDVILIYDVLDHAIQSSPKEILTLAGSMLDDKGKIYLRTHPWTSRHGGHTYRKINKAFVHLVFTEKELMSMGVELEKNLKTLSPLISYKSWIEESGLKNSIDPELDRQDVESFFKDNDTIKNRILKLFGKEEWKDECPEWQMSQCFWDYVLEKA